MRMDSKRKTSGQNKTLCLYQRSGLLFLLFLSILAISSCTTHIEGPKDQIVINQGESITLQGEVRYLGVSREEASSQIQWNSSLSGDLGQGASLATKLPVGLHEITARAERSASSAIRIYVDNTAPQCWAPIKQHSIAKRFKHTAFVLKNQLWVMGGIKNPDVFIYPRSDMLLDFWQSPNGVIWEQGPNEIGHNPAGAKSVVVENQAMVTGGGQSMIPHFEFISHQNFGYLDDYTRGVEGVFLPERRDHSMLKFKDKLWLMAGYGGEADSHRAMGWTNEKLRRDVLSSLDGERWEETATSFAEKIPWAARQGHAGVVFKGKMWILGGRTKTATGYSAANDIWVTKDGETWEEIIPQGDIWGPRAWHTAVVYQGRLYVMGGLSFVARGAFPDHTAWGDVWVTDDGQKWEKQTYAKGCEFPPVYGHTATVMNNRIYLIGGYDTTLSDFEGYIRTFRLE